MFSDLKAMIALDAINQKYRNFIILKAWSIKDVQSVLPLKIGILDTSIFILIIQDITCLSYLISTTREIGILNFTCCKKMM